MATLNLGILAHVDAGKTTLTERLLYLGGAIRQLGTVDGGTTQTDTLELERERGITIKSAVASFAIDDLTVNILDTPGHPDFIAEVERVLRVLDGAILVVSAVEGVQPQTPLLFRALQRLGVPTIFFLNKLDRRGADPARVLDAISRRLTPDVVAMGEGVDVGSPGAAVRPANLGDPAHEGGLAERLAEHDEQILAGFVEGTLRPARLRTALAAQTRAGRVHPAFLGAAGTGAGVPELLAALPELLPAAGGSSESPLAGRVFKIDRGPSGERVAYVRLTDGTMAPRDQVDYGDGQRGRVTWVSILGPDGRTDGAHGPSAVATAGQIVRVGGLAGIRVGDPVGSAVRTDEQQQFPAPALESVVTARKPEDKGRLRAALNELAEQDPLIDVRQDDERGEIWVSLYGEVQKEVIGETLARDYGVEASFSPTSTIYVERPVGTGERLEVISAPSHANISGKSSPLSENPFAATLGLRIEPGKPGSGIVFLTDVDVKLVPIYVYDSVPQFEAQMAAYVAEALEEGIHGWRVTDCVVTLYDSGYVRTGSTAADFRRLTPLLLAEALREAGVVVCEPMSALRVDAPAESARGIVGVILATGGRILGQHSTGERATVAALVQAGRVHEVQARIPGLTGGEGVLEASFAGYHPVASGPPPSRRRSRPNPFNRQAYLAALGRRG